MTKDGRVSRAVGRSELQETVEDDQVMTELAARLARALIAIAVLFSALTAGVLLYDRRTATPVRPGPLPPSTNEPTLIYLNGARDTFILAGPDGSERGRKNAGGSMHSFAIDPTGKHVAAWRETTRPETFDLVLWRIGGDVTTLLPAAAEFPVGPPVWSARGTDVAVGIARLAAPGQRSPGTPPLASRVLVVPIDGGLPTEVTSYGAEDALVPIALNDRLMVGTTQSRYLVIDLPSRQVRESINLSGLKSYGADPRSGLVFGVFGDDAAASQLETLRVWRIDGYNIGVVSMVSPTVNGPIFWPGRGEVIFGTSTQLRAFDVRTGRARDLVVEDSIVMPAAISPEGDKLIAKRLLAPLLKLFELDGDALRSAPDAASIPAGGIHLVGW